MGFADVGGAARIKDDIRDGAGRVASLDSEPARRVLAEKPDRARNLHLRRRRL